MITTILVPYASEQLHKNQIELDNSVSARLLKEGKFIHPVKGITFYIKEIETDETLVDILLMIREIRMKLSYTAKQALIARDKDKQLIYAKRLNTVI